MQSNRSPIRWQHWFIVAAVFLLLLTTVVASVRTQDDGQSGPWLPGLAPEAYAQEPTPPRLPNLIYLPVITKSGSDTEEYAPVQVTVVSSSANEIVLEATIPLCNLGMWL